MYYIKGRQEDDKKANVDNEMTAFHLSMLLDGASEKEKKRFLDLIGKTKNDNDKEIAE